MHYRFGAPHRIAAEEGRVVLRPDCGRKVAATSCQGVEVSAQGAAVSLEAVSGATGKEGFYRRNALKPLAAPEAARPGEIRSW